MPNFFINVKEKGAKKAEKDIKGLNNALGGLASKAALAAGGFFGAGMLLSGMKQAIDLAGEQELQERKLEKALGSHTGALLAQASALQQASIFGDEAIIQQQAYLASIGMSEQQIKEMIPVTLDLAAATGMSLESAVKNTAKTLSGMTGELGESVGALKDLTAEQLKAGEGIDLMRDMFKGMAEEETKTMSGSLTQLSNSVGDMAEEFGELLAPAVLKVVSALSTFVEGTSAFLDWANGVNSAKEAQAEFDKEVEESQTLIDDLSAKYGLNTDSSTTLTEQMYILKDALNELSKDDFFQGTINPAIAAQRDLRLQIEDLQIAIKDQIELSDSQAIKQEEHTKNYLENVKKVKEGEETIADAIKFSDKTREDARKKELEGMIQSTGSIQGEIRKQIKAKFASMIAGILEKEIGTKGLFGLALAPIAAAGASQLFDKLVPAFATGGDFVTNGKQMIMVGDNPSGRERVQITPLGGDPAPDAPSSSVTVNVSGNVMSQDFVEGQLAEQIKDAVRRGADFGIN